MIKKYIQERMSWIICIVVLHGLFLFIAWIDPTIPFTSIVYMVFLSSIIFLIFFIIRYRKETSFYRQLSELDTIEDMSTTIKRSPFETMVQEHLLHLEQIYTDEQQASASSLEREKDEIMAWVHEVKTPLTTMRLMLDTCEPALKQSLLVEWLRIDLLLDQQLHQKRIPLIENDSSIQLLSLQPLIHKEIKHVQSWCMQKGIGFDISIRAEEVLSDETWVRFMIRQILTNAVKYSEQKDIIIESSWVHDQVQLKIQDFGKGISTKDLPRIFDKGFTSTSNQRNQSATGMGLYLVHQVATHLSITVDVTSQVGKGTIVVITFPKENAFIQLRSM